MERRLRIRKSRNVGLSELRGAVSDQDWQRIAQERYEQGFNDGTERLKAEHHRQIRALSDQIIAMRREMQASEMSRYHADTLATDRLREIERWRKRAEEAEQKLQEHRFAGPLSLLQNKVQNAKRKQTPGAAASRQRRKQRIVRKR